MSEERSDDFKHAVGPPACIRVGDAVAIGDLTNRKMSEEWSNALHCIALHCIALHGIALHDIAWHCMALHGIAVHCIALHCCIALIA